MKSLSIKVWVSFGLKVALFTLLIITTFIPSSLAYLGLASSQLMGTILAGGLGLLVALCLLQLSYQRLKQALVFQTLVLVFLSFHLALASIYGSIDFHRGLLSLIPLSICILGAWALAELFVTVHSVVLNITLRWILLLLSVAALFGAAGWLQPTGAYFYPKPSFPFSEPSHFAITSAPFFIYACTTSRTLIRSLLLVACLILALLIENLTLVVVFFLASFLSIKSRYLIFFTVILIPLLNMLDLGYYADRIDFNNESQSISALVYLQGWQLIYESLNNTYGIGLGFQQLGVSGSGVDAARQLELLLGESQNLMDGGFTLSKLVSEFGIIGGGLFVLYLVIFIRAALLLRRVSFQIDSQPTHVIFAASSIVGYLIEMLVRGVGYFTPTAMLFIASILLWRGHATMQRQINVPKKIWLHRTPPLLEAS